MNVCYFELNEFGKALGHADKALQLNRNNISARLTNAKIFQKQNDKKRALKEYDTLTSIASDNWVVYYGRGDLYRSLGQKKLATKDFNRVKELALIKGDTALYKSADSEIQGLKKKH